MFIYLLFLNFFFISISGISGTVLIEESAHPYPNSASYYNVIEYPSAVGYEIQFHPDCSILSPDGLIFYKDSTYTSFWGSFWYAGDVRSKAWGSEPNYTLKIYASSFILHFASTSSYNDWGYLIYITPIMSEEELYVPSILEVDSPHDYFDNMDMYNTISIPGAIGYSIKFDERGNVISTDGLILYKDETHKSFWGSFWYAGDQFSGNFFFSSNSRTLFCTN